MMQTAQLRDMVIDKIYGINDSDYLRALKKILDMRQTSGEVYHLNEEQKSMIRLSKQQISNGEYISNEDLEKEEDQWLNE
jgi:regulatory protein YycI of two-component signal transduction system YycFG